jgi:signal transduction histidine kinase
VGEAVHLTTGTLIGVPLIAKDKVVGALEVINKLNGDFTLDDQDLLLALGAQAAIAIENTRLFQQSDQIAELVHELRTPMASLNTAVHLLMRSDLEEARRRKIIDMVRSEIERLSELTTAFLDLSKLESGRAQFQSEQVDLRQMLQDCVDVMQNRANERNIRLELAAPTEIQPIVADRDKLKQVAINLLSNAIKYNYPGGSVKVVCQEQNDWINISVTDTGPGISAEGLKRLFEKFYRVPGTEKLAPGTGLGLSICKRIIEVHGGDILVTSEVGRGTTFEVQLPAHRAKPA